MESIINPNLSVFSYELINSINIDSVLPEGHPTEEERLNFLATFMAENGAELNFEFHCSDSTEARDHIDSLVSCFKKNIYFLNISGENWDMAPDRLKRFMLKRKLELESVEIEVE